MWTYVYADYDSAVGDLQLEPKTLDDSDNYPPQVHIFIKDKDPWLNLTDDVNCYEKMYDQKTEWPEESLIRYKDYLKTRENKWLKLTCHCGVFGSWSKYTRCRIW